MLSVCHVSHSDSPFYKCSWINDDSTNRSFQNMNKVSNKNNFCEVRTTPWIMLNKEVEGNSVWSQSVTKKTRKTNKTQNWVLWYLKNNMLACARGNGLQKGLYNRLQNITTFGCQQLHISHKQTLRNHHINNESHEKCL